ncbi:MAG TPA: energy transducer TonB [Rhizomicrobium sp.]|nr:energy transducer TonB [Rhizomicrobium sp.]
MGILHVGLVWALIAGLASGLIEKLPEEIKAEVVQPKDDVKPPPPPPPDLAKPPPPFVPPPELNIASDAPVTNAITAVQPNVATPPAPVQAAPVITPSKAVGRSHDCSSSYPEMSNRLNEQGDVLIHYDVGVDGSISNVTVAKSSGHDRLDAAAVSCVSSKWRNTPAMNGGTPVASPGHEAIIRFVPPR